MTGGICLVTFTVQHFNVSPAYISGGDPSQCEPRITGSHPSRRPVSGSGAGSPAVSRVSEARLCPSSYVRRPPVMAETGRNAVARPGPLALQLLQASLKPAERGAVYLVTPFPRSRGGCAASRRNQPAEISSAQQRPAERTPGISKSKYNSYLPTVAAKLLETLIFRDIF